MESKGSPCSLQEAGEGELHGRITSEMIASHAPMYAESSFFVVGTDAFLGAMRAALAELGIRPDRVRTERFEGYTVK
jgi:ferredoxin-NADP reductase